MVRRSLLDEAKSSGLGKGRPIAVQNFSKEEVPRSQNEPGNTSVPSCSMKPLVLLFGLASSMGFCCAQTEERYTYDTASYDAGTSAGIGKYYMGREIAAYMCAAHADWLDRPERGVEERPGLLIKQLRLTATDVVADIGCGTGHHTLRIAPKVPQGKVYAVDIQRAMLDSVFVRSMAMGLENVDPVLGTALDPGLPDNSVDKALLVDVYHELEFPYEMMRVFYRALKPEGRLYLVEFRGEDEAVPIKPIHKMMKDQAIRELAEAGFALERSWNGLPWQHLLVFKKVDVANRSSSVGNVRP